MSADYRVAKLKEFLSLKPECRAEMEKKAEEGVIIKVKTLTFSPDEIRAALSSSGASASSASAPLVPLLAAGSVSSSGAPGGAVALDAEAAPPPPPCLNVLPLRAGGK